MFGLATHAHAKWLLEGIGPALLLRYSGGNTKTIMDVFKARSYIF